MSAIHPFHNVVAAAARQPRPAAPAKLPAYARAAWSAGRAAAPRAGEREGAPARARRVAAVRADPAAPAELR
ncbi:hypothetical protein J5226_12325 [Lysobacter sp. K5869]|uniref:hypothetical protein n=1 Tax=Lysobacter sp. K5869 TaxID=2820808 RepID=UPI001C05FFFB|nr:hypothetical protein [Lysobacter sp. K5869]QWP79117.1 hypothetical protein J5226_12325 [Lysobacter sp. K5869]